MNRSGLFLVSIASAQLLSRLSQQEVIGLLSENGFEVDVQQISFHATYERLSIEDARELRQKIAEVVHGATILVVADRLPEDSQQPLLKILEELPRNMQLILITPPSATILPTVISRAVGSFAIKLEEQEGEFTQKNLESLHKKDPELYKHSLITFGKQLLARITAAASLKNPARAQLYSNTLKLIERIPSARSAKMIGDYLLNIDRLTRR
ncbi:MAG TPA: hypothetical protein VGE63_01075 [Candidatus Paceibacterota bacterium]